MIQIIEKERFNIHLVEEDCKDNFTRRKNATALSDFESFSLTIIGKAMMPPKSEHFWCENDFRWWVRKYDKKGNPTHDAEFAVWLTENGICMYEDFDENKLYRIAFLG